MLGWRGEGFGPWWVVEEGGAGVVGEGCELRVAAPWVQCLPQSPAESGHGTRGLPTPGGLVQATEAG